MFVGKANKQYTEKGTTMELYTAYRASQIVNIALENAKIDKVLPPQMFYNYTSGRINKGKAPLIECVDGKITEDGLGRWLTRYLEKHGVKASEKVDEKA